MVIVNAMGDACPIPVVKTKRAIGQLPEGGEVCTLVDNEIAVQNLTKMAKQKGYDSSAQKLGEGQYQVHMVVPGPGREPENPVSSEKREETGAGTEKEFQEPETECIPQRRQRGTVAVISSDRMGNGSDELGLSLMKAFLYALASQDALPDRVIFYNGGAPLTCQGSACLTDIRNLVMRKI